MYARPFNYLPGRVGNGNTVEGVGRVEPGTGVIAVSCSPNTPGMGRRGHVGLVLTINGRRLGGGLRTRGGNRGTRSLRGSRGGWFGVGTCRSSRVTITFLFYNGVERGGLVRFCENLSHFWKGGGYGGQKVL